MRRRWMAGAAVAALAAGLGTGSAAEAGQVPAQGSVRFQTGVRDGEAFVNLTVDGPQAAGFLTAYPCGAGLPQPLTSNVNFGAGQTTSTAALVRTDANGEVCVFTSAPADIIVDQFEERPASDGSGAHPPVRVLDTRTDGSRLAAGTFRALQAAQPGDAVFWNLTAVQPADAGFLTAWPCDQPRPLASNVNYLAGDVVPNFVEALADASGKVCVYSSAATDIVVDQFAEGSNPHYHVHNPQRVVDTRLGQGGTRLRAFAALPFRAGGPGSVSFNLTAVNGQGDGYVTAWPCDAPQPLTSNVNFRAGATRSNFAKVQTSRDGDVCFSSNTDVDIVIDQVAEDSSVGYAHVPVRKVDTRVGLADVTPLPPVGTFSLRYDDPPYCLADPHHQQVPADYTVHVDGLSSGQSAVLNNDRDIDFQAISPSTFVAHGVDIVTKATVGFTAKIVDPHGATIDFVTGSHTFVCLSFSPPSN